MFCDLRRTHPPSQFEILSPKPSPPLQVDPTSQLESEYNHDDEELDNPLDEENWLLQTRGKYMKFVTYHSSTATEPRQTPNQELVSFRKGIKREETAYHTLKDERYFDSCNRSLYITAKSHECEEVLDSEYTPTNSEKELFEAKHVMFSVLDKHLLTDTGKTIVRKYVHTTDAQSVWKDFQEHMKSSSKGASEKRRLTQYITMQYWPVSDLTGQRRQTLPKGSLSNILHT